MKPINQFLCVGQPFWGFPRILVLRTPFPFNKVTKFLVRSVTSSNASRVGDYFTFHDPFYFPLEIFFDVFRFSWRVLSFLSYRCSVRFQQRHMEYWINLPSWRDLQFERSFPFLDFQYFEWTVKPWTQFFRGSLGSNVLCI